MATATLKITIDPVLNAQAFNDILKKLSEVLENKEFSVVDDKKIKSQLNEIANSGKRAGQDLKVSFTQSAAAAEQVTQNLNNTKSSLLSIKDIAQKAFNFNALNQAITTVANSVNSLSSQFVEIDKGLRNVGTLGIKNWKEFEDTINSFVKNGANATSITKALYDSISAGTVKASGGIADVAQAQTFLSATSKLAKAGLVDVTVTTDALTSVLNAYGASASEASKYSDLLFGAVKLGKTTVAELAPTLYNVVPTAKSAGISFEQVAASLATITKAGVPTSVATTQLRQLLVELMKPSSALASEMSKLGMSIETIKAEGLQKSMVRLNEELEKAGKTANVVFSSVEAANAFNALQLVNDTGAKVALQDLEYMQKEAIGSVEEAYALASQSIESKSKRMFGAIQEKLNSFFSVVSPNLLSIMNVMPQVAPIFSSLAAIKIISPVESIKSLSANLGTLKNNISQSIPVLKSGIANISANFANLGKLNFANVTNALKGSATTLTTTLIPATASGTLSWSAFWTAATGPVGLIVGGITAVTGAVVGMHYLTKSLREKSAAEKLKEVELEQNVTKQKLNLANEQVKYELNKQSKINALNEKYKNLQSKLQIADLSSSEKNKILDEQKILLADINKLYPNLIEKSDNYSVVLQKINKIQKEQEDTIIQQKSLAFQYEVKNLELDTKKASLSVQKSGEKITELMKSSSQGWFDKAFEWVTGTSPVEKKIISTLNNYKQAIYKAATDEEIKRAVVDFQSSIFTDKAFSSIPEETKLKMINEINDMGARQGDALKKALELMKIKGGKLEDYLPKVPIESAGFLSEFFAKVYENIKPFLDIIQPAIDIIKGLGIVISGLLSDFVKFAGDAFWGVLKFQIMLIIDGFKQLSNFINLVFVNSFKFVLDTFKNLGAWIDKVTQKIPILNDAFKFLKSGVDAVFGVINKIITATAKAFEYLRKLGAGEKEQVKAAITDKDIENAKKYDELQQKRIANNNAEVKQGNSRFEALRNEMTATLQQWDDLTSTEKSAKINNFQNAIRKATDFTVKEKQELDRLLGQMKNLNKSGIVTKEAAVKEYDEYIKVEEELRKKKFEYFKKSLEDENLKELLTLQENYKSKLENYDKELAKYNNAILGASSKKEKENITKAINATKELKKLEELEYSQVLEDFYQKVADKKIKLLDETNKKEIEKTKTNLDAVNKQLEKSNLADIKTLDKYKNYKIKILELETAQKINQVLKNDEVYKNHYKKIIEYELLLQNLKSQNKTEEAELASKNLENAQKELEEYIKAKKANSEEIKDIEKQMLDDLAVINANYNYKIRENNIKLISDYQKQQYELEKLQLEKEFDEKINKVRGNKAEELKIYVEYYNKRKQLDIDHISNTTSFYKDFKTLTSSLVEEFKNLTFDTNKELDSKLKNLEKEKNAVYSNYQQQKLSYVELSNELIKIDEEKNKVLSENNNKFIETFANSINNVLIKTIDSAKQSLDSVVNLYADYKNQIFEIENEIYNLQNKIKNKEVEDIASANAKINDLSEKKIAIEEQRAKALQKIYQTTATVMGTTFAQMMLQNKSFTKALVLSALAGARALVPVLIVRILGEELATKSLFGIGTAAVMSAVLYAALAAAESAVSNAKFRKGVVNLKGKGTSYSDEIPAMLSRGESVIPSNATQKNLKELRFLLDNDKNIFEYYKIFEPEKIKTAYKELNAAKENLSFINIITLAKTEDVLELKKIKKELKILNEKITNLNELTQKGNYMRKTNTRVDLALEVNDKELIKRVEKLQLSKLRRS